MDKEKRLQELQVAELVESMIPSGPPLVYGFEMSGDVFRFEKPPESAFQDGTTYRPPERNPSILKNFIFEN